MTARRDKSSDILVTEVRFPPLVTRDFRAQQKKINNESAEQPQIRKLEYDNYIEIKEITKISS